MCFQALKKAEGIRELTPELIQELHNRASITCGYLTSENIHVLQNKEFMKEAGSKIPATQKEELSNAYVERIIDVHNSDTRKESLLQKESQQEQQKQVDKSKGFEISM